MAVIAKTALVAAISLMVACAGPARADVTTELQQKMEFLQKELDAVKTQLYDMQQQRQKEEAKAAAAGGAPISLKPNSGATFLVPGGGEVQLYGNLDVSLDTTTKGLQSSYDTRRVAGRKHRLDDGDLD